MKLSAHQRDEQRDGDIEKAVIFMVRCLANYSNNKKPVILHSLRVGFMLAEQDEPTKVIQAGVLHDLIEDSSCTESEIKKRFGARVARLVSALTFDKTITDYKKRSLKLAEKIRQAGNDAMIIKVADNLQNLPYLSKISNQAKKDAVIWKHRHSIRVFAPYLQGNKLFEGYKQMVAKIKQ